MKQFNNECSIKCAGDNTASCGGKPNLVSLYITDSSSKSTFLICFIFFFNPIERN